MLIACIFANHFFFSAVVLWKNRTKLKKAGSQQHRLSTANFALPIECSWWVEIRGANSERKGWEYSQE
jgi:hypothetical protein